ncbi:MAG: DUF2791 family P-loop domain-containing protein, partial [Elusimicrobia bacterium]|nr:DUF2791 family P-loop domain-containing protein [Elusimicrobiota bacterium]
MKISDKPKDFIYKELARFVPGYLLEILHSKNYNYQFRPRYMNYTMLFADITGFTALSEKLTQMGDEGAERVVSLVNHYFKRLLKIADERDGYAVKFGGDALLFMFPVVKGDVFSSFRNGLCSARLIAEYFKQNPVVKTPVGSIRVNITMALNNGKVYSCMVGGETKRKDYFIYGKMLNELAKAESLCQPGEIIVCKSLRDYLIKDKIAFKAVKQRKKIFYRIKPENIPVRKGVIHKRFRIDYGNRRLREFVRGFVPLEILKRIENTDRLGFNEHKRTTSVFVNLDGKNMDKYIEHYFEELIDVAHKWQGTFNGSDIVERGVKFLITFGAPRAVENQEQKAVEFAFELQKRLKEFNKKFSVRLRQKIGINTGHVFCGIVGSSIRKEYVVMGDAVNTAARIMSFASHNRIVVGEETFNSLKKEAFYKKIRGRVKGKKGVLDFYDISGLKDNAISEKRGFFIGREKEIAIFKSLLNKVGSFGSGFVHIKGEAGIGKSFLVNEVSLYAKEAGFYFIRAECPSYSRSLVLYPWVMILRNLMESTGKNFRKLIAEYCSSDEAFLLGELLGLDLNFKTSSGLMGEQRKNILLNGVIRIMKGFVDRNKPVLIAIEDYHWADELSCELLDKLSSLIPAGLLLVITSRDFNKKFKSGIFTEIKLKPFSLKETENLIKRRFPDKKLDTAFVREILKRSNGNPFFISEIVNSLKEDEFGFKEAHLPEKIGQILLARIEQLPQKAKNLLKCASVIGTTFRLSLLKEVIKVLHLSPQVLTDGLEYLQKKNLLNVVLIRNIRHYSFRHILIQQTAYGTLSYHLRRRLHRLIGFWYEKKYKSNLSQIYETLAYHFEKAEMPDKGFEFLFLSAEKAHNMYANTSAIDFYRRAENLYRRKLKYFSLPRKKNLINLYHNQGRLYRLLGKYNKAISSFLEMQKWAKKIHSLRKYAYSLNFIGTCFRLKGFHQNALKWCYRALKISKRIKDENLIAFCLTSIGVIYWYLGRYKEAIRAGEESLALKRKSNDLKSVARGLFGLGNSYIKCNDINSAYRCFKELLYLSKKFNDLLSKSYSYEGMGYCFCRMGDIGRGINYIERSLFLRSQIEFKRGIAYSYCDLGEIYFHLGFIGEAESNIRKALKVSSEIEDSNFESDVLRNMGLICLKKKKFDLAFGYLTESYKQAIKTRFFEARVKSIYTLGYYYKTIGNFLKAKYY